MPSDPFVTPERVALRRLARDFANREIVPNIDQWERDGEVPRPLHKSAAAVGLLGLGFDEAVGGSGGDAIDYCTALEELTVSGRSSGLMMALFGHQVALRPILAHGAPHHVERFVRPTLAGERIPALAVTEPGGGSDVAALRTTARRDGDHFVVNGSKAFITSGERADYVVTAVRTGGPGHQGVSLLILEKGTPGFEVTRRLDKMGWNCSDTAELSFVDVRVPAENLIGAEGTGFVQIMELFQHERLGQATLAYSIAQRSLDLTVAWCRTRTTFGQTLTSRQVVRHKLADMALAVEVARTYTRDVYQRVYAGAEAVPDVCMAKRQSTDAAAFVVDAAVQLHGGAGYLRELEVNRHYRDARVMSIGGGANEVMTELVARRLNYV